MKCRVKLRTSKKPPDIGEEIDIMVHLETIRESIMIQPGFFDIENRYQNLSKFGDPLEKLKEIVNFEIFRSQL